MHRLGLDAQLLRNTASYSTPTWDECKNVRDLTLNLEKGEGDVTTRGSGGWRATVGTLKDASVEFQMVWNTADADFTAFQQAWLNDTSLDMVVLDGPVQAPVGGVASQGLRADWAVIGFSRSENLEEAIMVDVTIKPTYSSNAPTWFTGTVASS